MSSSAPPVEKAVTSVVQVVDSERDPKEVTDATGRDYSGTVEVTDPIEIALVKKLDWRLMPVFFCMYFMNFVGSDSRSRRVFSNKMEKLDRCAIASARLNGTEKDLKLNGTECQPCISILFVGYVSSRLKLHSVHGLHWHLFTNLKCVRHCQILIKILHHCFTS